MREVRAAVKQNVTAMRAAPRGDSEQVSQIIFGETVRVLGEEGDYAEIQSPDSYQGWTLRRHLAILEIGERYPALERAAMVAPLFLPVFREPSGRSERQTLLTLGTAVEVAQGEASGDYYPIRMPSGEVGYLEGGALIIPRFPSVDTLGPNLVVVARGLVGVPYLWGGRTPFGMDCSGFTQRVYWLCGHVIPRDAYLQARWEGFTPVERGSLQAGDLVFFAGDEDPRERVVTHVGIAFGDGRFIHAVTGLGVTITPLDAMPYARQFWGARRMKMEGEQA